MGPIHRQSGAALGKWRILHRFVHAKGFHPDPNLPREEQRRAVGRWWEQTIGDPEVAAWLAEQSEVAGHRGRGIRDLRPRKDGPCHALGLEYVGNRKCKALALHRFALAAVKAEPDLDWEVTPGMIARWRRETDGR